MKTPVTFYAGEAENIPTRKRKIREKGKNIILLHH